MERMKFIKNSAKGIAGAAIVVSSGSILSYGNKKSSKIEVSVNIPLPIQVVIDHVGWWSGTDGSTYNEPFRTGIGRNHQITDYQAIIDLGKALGIRPQAAMILCEWDRDNILRNVPHSTWMGKNWDNSKWVGPWLEEAADLINNNREHFEITMHGVGHEWWDNGVLSRAEWANEKGIMRPEEDIERHLDAFEAIMKQNNLGKMPTSLVPTNFAHCFGTSEGNSISMAEILGKRGFTNINTHYAYLRHKERSQFNFFGIDAGIMTIERKEDLLDWHSVGSKPEGVIIGPTCGTHWPNLLHEDPERNSEIVDAWVKLLAPYNNRSETMLSKNSLVFQKQLMHHEFTKVKVGENVITLDFSNTNNSGAIVTANELTIKVSSKVELSFTSDTIKIVSEELTRKDDTALCSLHLKMAKGTESASIILNQKT